MKRSDLVAALAEKISADLFLTMLNPQLRGPGFRYSAFDIGQHVRSRIGINLPSAPTAEELARAAVIAGRTWARLIAQVGDGIPKEVR